MSDQPDPKNLLVRFYLRHSLLAAALLLAVLLSLCLMLPLGFTTPADRVTLILLALLPAVFGVMMFHQYRNFVLPAQELLRRLLALSHGKTPLCDSPVPGSWKPWFTALEDTIHSSAETAREILRRNETLEQLIRERTAELEMINSSLGEEMEERSVTESALQVINKKLQEVSLVDGLTGIANRRKFDEYLQQVWRQMMRDNAPLSLILCEIDHFEQIKENCGYQAGDRCLQEVAAVIQNNLHRPGDLAARYERGKFLVALPRTDSRGAIQVAEKLQQAIAGLEIPHVGSMAGPRAGFTIGLASILPERGSTPATLLEMAELALDRAKGSGCSRLAI